MSYGLRVWNQNGGLKLDVSDRLARRLGVVSATLPAATTWLAVAPNVVSTDWFGVAYRTDSLFRRLFVVRESNGLRIVNDTASPLSCTVTFYGA